MRDNWIRGSRNLAAVAVAAVALAGCGGGASSSPTSSGNSGELDTSATLRVATAAPSRNLDPYLQTSVGGALGPMTSATSGSSSRSNVTGRIRSISDRRYPGCVRSGFSPTTALPPTSGGRSSSSGRTPSGSRCSCSSGTSAPRSSPRRPRRAPPRPPPRRGWRGGSGERVRPRRGRARR